MCEFLTNSPFLFLTLINSAVFTLSITSQVVGSTWSRRFRSELADDSHVIDALPSLRNSAEHSACQDAVVRLTDAVARYTECASHHALNARLCERCVDYYLNVSALVAGNFSVYIMLQIK